MKNRKFATLLISALIALSLTACGDKPAETTAAVVTSANAVTTVADTTANTTAEAANALEPLNVSGKSDAVVIIGRAIADENPNRSITPTRAPIMQVKTVDVFGNVNPDSMYYYRNILSAPYQKGYDQLYAGILKGASSINMSVAVGTNDIDTVVNCIYNDHPECFWMYDGYSYSYNNSGIVTSVTFQYNRTGSDISGFKGNFEAAINPLLNKAASLSSEYDRVKLVHDYLINTITYQLGCDLNQSAYSAIVNQITVCAGYAHAFQYCCQRLGIEAAYVVGDAGGPHAWNMLELGGDYYNMDVTWDDASDDPNTYYYNYFLVTDSVLNNDHTRGTLSAYLPACNGTALTFNGQYGSDLSDLGNYSAPSAPTTTPALTEAPPAVTTTAYIAETTDGGESPYDIYGYDTPEATTTVFDLDLDAIYSEFDLTYDTAETSGAINDYTIDDYSYDNADTMDWADGGYYYEDTDSFDWDSYYSSLFGDSFSYDDYTSSEGDWDDYSNGDYSFDEDTLDSLGYDDYSDYSGDSYYDYGYTAYDDSSYGVDGYDYNNIDFNADDYNFSYDDYGYGYYDDYSDDYSDYGYDDSDYYSDDYSDYSFDDSDFDF